MPDLIQRHPGLDPGSGDGSLAAGLDRELLAVGMYPGHFVNAKLDIE
jgi:hypothetical protein